MQINYDQQADALYIQLRDGKVDDTIEADKYIYVDVDADGVPVGLEILFAGRFAAAPDAEEITINFTRTLQTA